MIAVQHPGLIDRPVPGAGNLVDLALDFGERKQPNAVPFRRGISRGSADIATSTAFMGAAGSAGQGTGLAASAVFKDGRPANRFPSTATPQPSGEVSAIGLGPRLVRPGASAARTPVDQRRYALIAEVAFSSFGGVLGAHAGFGFAVGPTLLEPGPLAHQAGGPGQYTGVQIATMDGGVVLLTRNAAGVNGAAPLPWPTSDPQQPVRAELRITPAQPDSEAMLDVLLNDALVLRRSWVGLVKPSDVVNAYMQLQCAVGNYSRGGVADMWLFDWRQQIGPAL